MEHKEWERVRSIFAEALDMSTGERADFVGTACTSDLELRAEVDSLLAAHLGAGSFLEASALELPFTGVTEELFPPGWQVGQYRIVRQIGRGGMGAVYLAERADAQYHKQVAVKIVARGPDNDTIIRRFRHERQILADLDHPNIARLLDGGTTDDGLPYFVMECIDGVPITGYCAARNLSIRDRLDLFRSVCAAVHHAHQRLVVHCDIKPGNILVTEDGTPKLLDFGIARLLTPDRDQAAGSGTHSRAMTVNYASPEQLAGTTMTTLTDVYSLGVVLYELLAGITPFPDEAHGTRTPEQIGAARAGCIIAPPSKGAARSTEAGKTPREIARAQRLLRWDLDSITLKAIETSPQGRYTSVQQMGDDIRRYLRGQPVIARQHTLAYRSVKLIRRNTLASVAGAIFVVALLGGIATTSWQAHIADQQRRTAERRFADIRSLAISLISEVNDSIATLPGTTSARKLIVVRALESLDALSRDARGDRGLQYDLASAYLKVGDVQGNPYRPNLGETRAARQSYGKARAILTSLANADPHNLRTLQTLALADERVGAVSLRARDWAEGERYEHLAVSLGEELLRADPSNAGYRRALSDALIYLGDALAASDDQWSVTRIRSARSSYMRALTIREGLVASESPSAETLRGLSTAYNRIAYTGSSLWKVNGDVTELRSAMFNHRQSEQISLALLASSPGNAADRRVVADGAMDIAQVQEDLGDLRGALATFASAGPIFKSLADADPANVEAKRDLAYFHENIGVALFAAKQNVVASQHERLAISMLQSVQRADPASNEEYFHLVHAQETLAAALGRQGRGLEAVAVYASALKSVQGWMMAEPGNVRAMLLASELKRRMNDVAGEPVGVVQLAPRG